MRRRWEILKPWDELPKQMKNPKVRHYYSRMQRKSGQLKAKRAFDIFMAWFMIVALFPLMALTAALIYWDSGGPVFYRQVRVTQYGRTFKICKFRTMVVGADQLGPAVTGSRDARVTNIGSFLRRTRLDELPQLFNIAAGDMTFVGTRPEVPAYVKGYTQEMWATLLLPSGVTSPASIRFKDEAELLEKAEDIDEAYIKEILPQKMRWNLRYLEEFCLLEDLKVMIRTVAAVLK